MLSADTTVAFTCRHLAKHAALFFDRIWVPPREFQDLSFWSDADKYGDDQPPPDIAYCGQEDVAIYSQYADTNEWAGNANPFSIIATGRLPIAQTGVDLAKDLLAARYRQNGVHVVRVGHGRNEEPTASPSSVDLCEGAYDESNHYLIDAVLGSIPVPSVTRTSWQQVSEFRCDPESVRMYRNLRLWLHSGISAESPSHASDLIGQRVDRYEWALKKHGYETVLGSLEQLLDPTTIASVAGAAAVTGLFHGSVMAALAATTVAAGRVSVWAAKRLVERKDLDRYNETADVALLRRLVRRFSTTEP